MTPFPWSEATDLTLAKLWRDTLVPVEQIAQRIGCTVLEVRYRVTMVLKLPPRYPIACERASRAKPK